MVSVLLIWVYMAVTCYLVGFAILSAICKGQDYVISKESSFLFAGAAAVTVYAQFFSIFYKVGLAANGILLLICAVCGLLLRKELAVRLRQLQRTITPVKAGALVLLCLLFAYGASRGMIHYDTGLYHAQSIRWIEAYGIVPGLGNLHSRLAYNSASFCLSALYSFSFLGGQSYHAAAGFYALLLAVVCTEALERKVLKKNEADTVFWQKQEGKRSFAEKAGGIRLRLADLVRLMGVYYLLIIFDEMVSPASDYFMVLSVFYIIIRWLDLLEQKEKSYLPYALLCILCVSVLTIKLSGALILLLTIKPAVMMLQQKKGRAIAGFLGLGFVTALPFFIRNVILSGWLLYPFTAIDLFDFDFKIPKGMADYDSKEIQVWGRGFSDVLRYDEPVSKWLPEWAEKLDSINQVFLLLALAALIVLAGLSVYALWKRRKDMADYLLVAGTMGASFLFWLTSAPLVRYGCVYLWVFPMLVWGYCYQKLTPKLDKGRLYLAFLLVFGIYKAGAFAVETAEAATADYLIYQKDYENFETVPYELNGYTFYYPAHGDRTGYEDFPASPIQAEDIFRGETIKEGFASKEK